MREINDATRSQRRSISVSSNITVPIGKAKFVSEMHCKSSFERADAQKRIEFVGKLRELFSTVRKLPSQSGPEVLRSRTRQINEEGVN